MTPPRWFNRREVMRHAAMLDSGPGPEWGGDITGLDVAIMSAVDVAIKNDLKRLTGAAK